MELVQSRMVTEDVAGLARFYAALVGVDVVVNDYYVEVPTPGQRVGLSRMRFSELEDGCGPPHGVDAGSVILDFATDDLDAQHGRTAVEAIDLDKTYPGDVHAVRGISFGVHPGEAFGLLGPNGAGKSTTIGMLNSTVRPTAGRALLGGLDVAVDPVGTRARSSVVFQDTVVDHPLTGRQNLELHLRLWGRNDTEGRARLAELAQAVGLTEYLDRAVSTYSGGQRRRMEIVRALASDPEVLFLDEPTVGLDTRVRHDLFDALATLRERTGVTILMTTHYLDEAERLCDRVAIVDRGRIVACDTPQGLLDTLGSEVLELRLDDPERAVATLVAAGVPEADVLVIGTTLTVLLRGQSSNGLVERLWEASVPLRSVTTRRPTFDDVYLRVTGDHIGTDQNERTEP
jgi:ABC-2 type transport system ATP-binding protein